MCAVDVDLAIHPFELVGTGVVRHVQGGLDFDEGFVGIVVFVEPGRNGLVGLSDEVIEQDGVACNVEQVYRDERYGQQLFQPGNFFNLEKFRIVDGKFLWVDFTQRQDFTQSKRKICLP